MAETSQSIYLKRATKTPETETDAARRRSWRHARRDRARAARPRCATTRAKLDNWTGDIVVTSGGDRAPHARHPRAGQGATSSSRPRRCANSPSRSASRSASSRRSCSPGSSPASGSCPCNVAGCYVPTGRYAHIASAYMSIATAKAAGVPHRRRLLDAVTSGEGIHPHVLYAMKVAGADVDA